MQARLVLVIRQIEGKSLASQIHGGLVDVGSQGWSYLEVLNVENKNEGSVFGSRCPVQTEDSQIGFKVWH